MAHIKCNYKTPFCSFKRTEFDDVACLYCDYAETLCGSCLRKKPFINEEGIKEFPDDECGHLGWYTNEFEDDFKSYYLNENSLGYELQVGKGKSKKIIRYINDLLLDGKQVIKDGEKV